MQISTANTDWTVVALYRFFAVGDPQALREKLSALCCQNGIKGTLIIANEGINGTIAGSGAGIGELVAYLEQLDGFSGAKIKYSTAEDMPMPPVENVCSAVVICYHSAIVIWTSRNYVGDNEMR